MLVGMWKVGAECCCPFLPGPSSLVSIGLCLCAEGLSSLWLWRNPGCPSPRSVWYEVETCYNYCRR